MPKFFRSGDKSNRLSKPRKININMPQLVPFFFVNQVVFAFVILTVLFGIYPALILDGLHYSVSSLIYSVN